MLHQGGQLCFTTWFIYFIDINSFQVGQHIGALDYLLPDEYVQTLKILHHKAPEMGMDDVYQVIREDLGVEVRIIYSRCNNTCNH